jgi:putative tricarboxylic transport membrane protein
MTIGYFLEGLISSFEPMTFLIMFSATVAGIVIGALPGLTGSMAIILSMPLLAYITPAQALLVLAAIFCGGMYGGSISAILISTPGGPSASATLLDGYPMARQGKAGKALGIAVFASFIGGIFSSFGLLLVAPLLAKLALSFQAQDYFSLSIFGLTIMASAGGGTLVKGLIAGWIGLLLSTVGVDGNIGMSRFTFDFPSLMSGVNLLPVLIGIFAMSQLIENAESLLMAHQALKQDLKDIWPSWLDMKRISLSLAVGCVVGIFIGIMPGAGGAIACFMAYDIAKRLYGSRSKFGTGVIEGIAAPESANNACTGGDMVPLLTLGIPGDVQTAVMLGALMLIGIRPGPLLFIEQREAVYTLLAGMFVIQFLILFIGLAACRISPKILSVPPGLLNPSIFLFCVVGTFTLGNSLFDVKMTLVFGFIGYLMRKFGYPGAPMVLGLILGPIAEDHLNRALLVTENDWSTFVTRPISCFFLILSALSIVTALYSSYHEAKMEKKMAAGN